MKTLLPAIAALLLATGTANAENKRVGLMLFKCDGREVTLWEEIYPKGGRSLVLELPFTPQPQADPREADPNMSFVFKWAEKAELSSEGKKCEVMWPTEEN